MRKGITRSLLSVIFLMILFLEVKAQCPDPRLYDLNLTRPSNTPFWENCIDNASDPNQFVMSFLSPNDIQNYVLEFGDGTSTSGALWPANTPINHTYQLGRFTVTLRETRNGCTRTVNGVLVNDRKAGASAMPPTIGSSGCVPHSLTFTNMSTNASPFTVFEWDWGDGTRELAGPETVGGTISHTYERGRAGCNMVVTLRAYSLCDTTFSSYGPYDFWDIDTAVVTASAIRICGGQNVTFTDQSRYNCNVRQPRRIRWDFRQIGGPLTGWLPATQDNRTQTQFVSGNVGDRFTVFLEDSNFCGVDPTAITVEIIAPPQARVELPVPTICVGENGVFRNTSTGNADLYIWDFGDGSPRVTVGSRENISHRFTRAGTFNVKLIAAASGTDLCRDSTTINIEVLPSSLSDFSVDNIEGCAPLSVNITENSQNAVSWSWDMGSLGTFNGRHPAPLHITDPGTYQIRLNTSNSLGCGNSFSRTVTVYPDVVVAARVDSACLGTPIEFLDRSTIASGGACASGTILREQWDNINGTAITALTSNNRFPANPSSSSLLTIFESPTNVGDNYGSRVRGFICPPQTGNYVFWIASDDNSELWLSTDNSPANRVLIASVTGFTNTREWNKFTSQQSVPIYLVSGRRYYIEALHKEGTGGDHLSVGWQLPSGVRERPIPGNRLSPFSEGSTIESWTWNFGDGNTSNLQNPIYKYTAPGEYKVALTVSTGKCSRTDSFPVLITPGVVARFSPLTMTGCTPLEVDFVNTSEGASRHLWDFGDGNTAVHQQGEHENFEHVFINNSGADRVYHVRLIAESEAGCKDTMTGNFTVHPGPKAEFTFAPSVPQCSPVTINFNNTSSVASEYVWLIGNYDTIRTDERRFSYNMENKTGAVRSDSIFLRAYSPSGCYGEAFQVVTIFPEAEFQITADPDTVCHPGNVSFSVNGETTSRQWVFGDGAGSTLAAPVHQYLNNGVKDTTYLVTFTGRSPFGCQGTASTNVTVYPSPVADLSADISTGCSPLNVTFQNLSFGGEKYIWDMGDGNVDTVSNTDQVVYLFENLTPMPKEYLVVLTAYTEAGCISKKQIRITVYPKVVAGFDLDKDRGCAPLLINFMNSSTGANTYSWNFGNGNGANMLNPVQNFINNSESDTTYRVLLTATSSFGCRDTISRIVQVFNSPVANFITNINQGCSPLTIDIHDLSTSTPIKNWQLGEERTDTITSASFSYIFVNDQPTIKEFPLILEVETSNGCKAERSQTIRVYPEVDASFSVDNDQGCSPLTVNFLNASLGATSYSWNFGNGSGSSATEPSQVFLNSSLKDTAYIVRLTATSSYGCRDTASSQIHVNYIPYADFTLNRLDGCSPLEISVNEMSIGAVTYFWDLGDGLTDTITTKEFSYMFLNETGVQRSVSLIHEVYSAKGCRAEKRQNIVIYPQVVADFEPDRTDGCHPLTVQFENRTVGATSYSWSFGDGSSLSLSDPTKIFNNNQANDTTFRVRLIATSMFGCRDTTSSNITVYPLPIADFTISRFEGCSPLEIGFNDLSEGGDKILWDFGKGITDTVMHKNFQVTFKNDDTSTDELVLIQSVESVFGCAAERKQTIRVFPEVNAAFTMSDTAGCDPLLVSFINSTEGASSYSWNMSNGASSRQHSPTQVFRNNTEDSLTFNISLVATSPMGCTDTTSGNVVVYPLPIARFQADIMSGCSPLEVAFVNTSRSAVSGSWNFGDGTLRPLENDTVSHVFENLSATRQDYQVGIDVTSIHGCTAAYKSSITVFPEVGAYFLPDVEEGCSPLNVKFTNLSHGANNFSWTFGDGNTFAGRLPSHNYKNESDRDTIFTVNLIARSSFDCEATYETQILVFPKPVAEMDMDPVTGCAPLDVTFTNSSAKAERYNWDFGIHGSSTSDENEFTRTFHNGSAAENVVNVRLTAISSHECRDSVTRILRIYPQVSAAFATSDSAGCSPWNMNFFNLSQGASSYNWDFGTGINSVENAPKHTFINSSSEKDTVYRVRLISSNVYSCRDTVYKEVLVFARPKAEFLMDQVASCSPMKVNFINTSTGGSRFSWDFDDGTNYDSTGKELSHVFYNKETLPINSVVELKVSSDNGCESVYSRNVTTYPEIIASFEHDPSGCSPFTVKLKNTTVGAVIYKWNLGDGSISTEADPTHTYRNIKANDTTFTIKFAVASVFGCSDTTEVPVTVYSRPVSLFSVVPGEITLPDSTVQIINRSSPGNWQYSWDFGDGEISSQKDPLVHYYDFYGTYNIRLAVTGGHCSDTSYQRVVVRPTVPIAGFEGEGEGCTPLSVQFTNTSRYAEKFYWDFGDGNVSEQRNPRHTYLIPGIYNVTLKASGLGGEDMIIKEDVVKVYPVPSAFFRVRPDNKVVKIPGNAHYFANLSEGGTNYSWNLGDGNTSSERSPLHTYSTPGIYDVTLTVTNEHGCSSTFFEKGAAIAEPGGKIVTPNAFTPAGGGNLHSAGKNDIFYPLSEGVIEFHMQIFNRWGELIFESRQVNVGWDGYYRGRLCKQDVYVYKIKAKFFDGEVVDLVGDVTLIR